jgi:hypothetical protein
MAYDAENKAEEMAALGDGNLDLKSICDLAIAAGCEYIMFEQVSTPSCSLAGQSRCSPSTHTLLHTLLPQGC